MRNEAPQAPLAHHGAGREVLSFVAWSARWFARRVIGLGGLAALAVIGIAAAWYLAPSLWPVWQSVAIIYGVLLTGFMLLGYVRSRAVISEAVLRQEARAAAEAAARARADINDRVDAFAEHANRRADQAQAEKAQQAAARTRMAISVLEQRISQLEAAAGPDPQVAAIASRLTKLERGPDLSAIVQRIEKAESAIEDSAKLASLEERLNQTEQRMKAALADVDLKVSAIHMPDLAPIEARILDFDSLYSSLRAALASVDARVNALRMPDLGSIETRLVVAEASIETARAATENLDGRLTGRLSQAVEMLETRTSAAIAEIRATLSTRLEEETAANIDRIQKTAAALVQRIDVVERNVAVALDSAQADVKATLREELAAQAAELTELAGSGTDARLAALRTELDQRWTETVRAAEHTFAERVADEMRQRERQFTELANQLIAQTKERDALLAAMADRVTAEGKARAEDVAALNASAKELEQRASVDAQHKANVTRKTLELAVAELKTKIDAQFDEARSALISARQDNVAAQSAATVAHASLSARLSEVQDTTTKRVDAIAAQAARAANAEADAAKALADVAKAQADATKAQTDLARVQSTVVRSGIANAAWVRPVDRYLAPEKLARLEQHWLKVFGLNMTKSAIAYLAHQIATMEDRIEGRLACSIATAVVRQLALRSLPPGQLQVMEIGTLFGMGGACLHRFAGPRMRSVKLTLIDPLAGYYESGNIDPTSGVPVDRKTLERNLRTLGIPDTDWRLIQRLSTDPLAVSEASDRLYDLILIDGDHSVDGVARDFELYSPMVKPGGIVLFDDYGNPHWPGIQPWVDDYARKQPGWVWIGGEFSTGIMRRATDAVVEPPSADRALAAPRKRAPRKVADDSSE